MTEKSDPIVIVDLARTAVGGFQASLRRWPRRRWGLRQSGRRWIAPGLRLRRWTR